MEKFQGVVKWFNNEKGFGFIQSKDQADVFVHYTAIQTDGFKGLTEGEKVEFNVVNTAKGTQAENVVSLGINT